MAKAARERLAGLLGGSVPAGSFSAQLSVPAQALDLEVSGVGPVTFPVRAAQAKKLITVARPAMFGLGEQTMTDTAVRDTWEITPEQVTLGGSEWDREMARALEHVRDELRLPATARLRTELHSMLVYGKGQFFLPHQDSEKDDAMVGTLVVSLPSTYTGGELVVEHGGQSTTHRASKTDLTFVAFYSDCRHQVMPVRSGHRLTLTFNVLNTAQRTDPADPDDELARCLTEHFRTPPAARYGRREAEPPNRLVFLLDHEYSQRGLSWSRLKGADSDRAARLRAAAGSAGCQAVLALAEVQETWDALEPEPPYYYDDEEDEDEVIGAEDVELNDLIDDEITLGWWTTPEGGGEPISLHVLDDEVCTATPSVALTPYRSEYEGYMGNYGNTLDRWYRRAAIVVWPRERAFAARAEAGSRWALDELHDRLAAGELEDARAAAASLTPFWPSTTVAPELFSTALDVATRLDDAGTAAMILAPFRLEAITSQHADGLAAATRRYGEGWAGNVLHEWLGRRTIPAADEDAWVSTTLPGLSAALRAADGGPTMANLLVTTLWREMDRMLRMWTTTARSDYRRPQLERLSTPLARLLEAADPQDREHITAALAERDDTVLECLLPALRHAEPRETPWLDAIVRDCTRRLRAIAARPPRADDDWSITWTGCGCELCATLEAFLRSRSEQVHRWPLATKGRQHVHHNIDSAELPVRHDTLRRGRPYTLVLTKTDDLFTRDRNARAKAAADLAWLVSTWGEART